MKGSVEIDPWTGAISRFAARPTSAFLFVISVRRSARLWIDMQFYSSRMSLLVRLGMTYSKDYQHKISTGLFSSSVAFHS